MKIINRISLTLFTTLFLCLSANAQTAATYVAKKQNLNETELERWPHLDLVKDSIPGMSVDKAYTELLKDKKSTKIIGGKNEFKR